MVMTNNLKGIGMVVMIIIFVNMFSLLVLATPDSAAENTMNKLESLSESQIKAKANMISSQIGKGTVFRWEKYIDPKSEQVCVFDNIIDYEVKTRLIGSMKDKIKQITKEYYEAADAASKNKYGVKVTVPEIYTMSIGEGFNWYLKKFYCSDAQSSREVSAYTEMGLDTFANEITELKQGGFLRQNFDENIEYYIPGYSVFNERNEEIKPVYFYNKRNALYAFAARVAWAKHLFLEDIKALGVSESSLTEDQIFFWTYAYFNAGHDYVREKYLQKYVKGGFLDDSSFRKVDSGVKIKNGMKVRHNSLIRLGTYKFLKSLEIFE